VRRHDQHGKRTQKSGNFNVFARAITHINIYYILSLSVPRTGFSNGLNGINLETQTGLRKNLGLL